MGMPGGVETTSSKFQEYKEGIDGRFDNEQELIDKVVRSLKKNNEWACQHYGRAVRDAHAKGHGLLRGELRVYDDSEIRHPELLTYLRQGMFATAKTYPVVARLSSTPGAIRSDQVRGVRAIAVKVIGVDGAKLLGEDESKNQDFVMVNRSEFFVADVEGYSKKGMVAAWLLARLPDRALSGASFPLRGIGRLLKLVGRELPPIAELFTRPNFHHLGQTFHTAAPLRYGEYIAKIRFVPVSKSVTDLQKYSIGKDAGFEAQRKLVAEFFKNNSAEYEVQVQLCTTPHSMSLDDATRKWSDDESPPLGMARLTFPAQDTTTAERLHWEDEVLSFNSWIGLEAHRPLGSINRLKKDVYLASSKFRHEKNKVTAIEPDSVDQLPV